MLILYQPTHPCLGPVYAEASVYAEDRERPREALGGGALTTWHPTPPRAADPRGWGFTTQPSAPGGDGDVRPQGCPAPPPPGASVQSHEEPVWGG